MIDSYLPKMKYAEEKGLVSIIVPMFNVEKFLKECLDSILAQTFSNWEAILVDDCSLDNSGKIADDYEKNDSRFYVIHKQKNEGLLLARKTGLENSRGEFIANLDSDDIYHPQFLERMYDKIIETNYDFVWCNYQDIGGNRPISRKVSDCVWNENSSVNIASVFDFYHGMACYMWNKLIKREIYVKTYFPNMYIVLYEDHIQIYQIIYNSKSVAFVPENLYFYRIGGSSSKKNLILCVKGQISIIKVLENLYSGTIPNNLKNVLLPIIRSILVNYFFLDKVTKIQFKDEFEPIFQEFIRHEKKLVLRICLVLANIGVIFPLKLGVFLKAIFSSKNKANL